MSETLHSFRRQFAIGRDENRLPPEWPSVRGGEWHLSHHPSLPVKTVCEDNSGSHVGFMLGWPVSPQGQIVEERVLLPSCASPEVLHDELYRYSGSWACMLQIGEEWRIYGDPFHSVPIVYHIDRDIIASSTGLVPAEWRSEDQAIAELLNIPDEDNWYPFGLTPYQECRRLYPNHYLKLDTAEAVRHWPHADTFGAGSQTEIMSTIIRHVRKNIQAFVEDKRPYLSLTAGRDSRLLLACAREVSDAITCHTVRLPDENAHIDFQVASHITKKFGLEHEAQSFMPPQSDDLKTWLARTGCCVAGRTWQNVTTLKQLDASRPRFEGIGGEIGRAYYRNQVDAGDVQFYDPEDFLNQLHLPVCQRMCEAAKNWFANTPALNGFHLMDLLYIEQRIGCWGSLVSLGHADSAYSIFPFCDRRVVHALVSLDEEQKRSEAWMTDVIERTWPELLSIPFDQYVGWPRVEKKIRSRLTFGYLRSLPRRIYGRLRALWAR